MNFSRILGAIRPYRYKCIISQTAVKFNLFFYLFHKFRREFSAFGQLSEPLRIPCPGLRLPGIVPGLLPSLQTRKTTPVGVGFFMRKSNRTEQN